MNNENLIPNNKRTPSEVRENARKGGINSGKSRREKKTVKKILSDLLDSDIKDMPQFDEIASKFGVDNKKSVKDLFALICILNTIKKSNLYDLELLTKLLGEDNAKTNGNGILDELTEYLKK